MVGRLGSLGVRSHLGGSSGTWGSQGVFWGFPPVTCSPVTPPPPPPGTPTEETWPGIGANAEFRAHKYPPYPPEGLLHHAPRSAPRMGGCPIAGGGEITL